MALELEWLLRSNPCLGSWACLPQACAHSLNRHFSPLFRQKRATKQDSTCRAKFSTTRRKRRPLEFKQPGGCSGGGQRRSTRLAWENTLLRPPPPAHSAASAQRRKPTTSASPGRRPSALFRPASHAGTCACTYLRASSGCPSPVASARQTPLPASPAPPRAPPRAPPQDPPLPAPAAAAGPSVTTATPGRHCAFLLHCGIHTCRAGQGLGGEGCGDPPQTPPPATARGEQVGLLHVPPGW